MLKAAGRANGHRGTKASGDAARLTELMQKLRVLNLELRRAIKYYETKRESEITDPLRLGLGYAVGLGSEIMGFVRHQSVPFALMFGIVGAMTGAARNTRSLKG